MEVDDDDDDDNVFLLVITVLLLLFSRRNSLSIDNQTNSENRVKLYMIIIIIYCVFGDVGVMNTDRWDPYHEARVVPGRFDGLPEDVTHLPFNIPNLGLVV